MDALFDKEFYHKYVLPNYDVLDSLWNKVGAKWINEISGGIADSSYDMNSYNEFPNLSGEEQYAFYVWCKRNNLIKEES